MGVLKGVRILEIAGIGPGPFCGMLLADLGADVITVERMQSGKERPRAHQIVQRGKRSIVLDLKQPRAVDAVLRLVGDSDALIEGMRPGVMERLGLGPDACLARKPSLIYGRMTGWGQFGPLAHAAGHDSNYTALAGALWFASPPGVPQLAPPTLLGDIGGGALYLALGIVSGILRARSDGRGQVVDAAIVDGVAHMMNLLLGVLAGSERGQQRGVQAFDAAHWAGRSYQCSDSKWVNLASLEPQFYAVLLAKLGLEQDEMFAKGHLDPASWPVLGERLASLFAARTQAHWCEVLEGSDACFAPVLKPMDAANHPHMAARQVFTRVDGVLQAVAAPRFSMTPCSTPGRVPARGGHGREILAEAGFAEDEISRLAADAVLG